MKLLILGLVPVIIFWGVEEEFGTFWGLIAAAVWSVGECTYELRKYGRIQKFTLLSMLLVVGLGGLSLILDNSAFFKFQPVILEVAMMGILWLGGRGEDPALFKMAKQVKPEAFEKATPEQLQFQRIMMRKLTLRLQVLLFFHVLVLSWAALHGTTGQWAFAKGVGFNLLLVLWLGWEFFAVKRRAPGGKSQ